VLETCGEQLLASASAAAAFHKSDDPGWVDEGSWEGLRANASWRPAIKLVSVIVDVNQVADGHLEGNSSKSYHDFIL